MPEETWNHWDVYRDCLFHLGYGYPLWHPFGEEGAVWLGDVGWVREGKFYPLFNSMRKEDDVVHFLRGVPRDFRPITVDYQLRIVTDLLGHSATQSTPEGDFFVDARNHQHHATIPYQGAAVIAKPIRRQTCVSRAHITHYIAKHLDNWLEFANASCGLDPLLHPEDIVFVSGTTMTTKWAMEVYQGEDAGEQPSERVRNLFYGGDIDRDPVSASLRHSSWPGTDFRYHHGPNEDGNNGLREPDQCLFIHYFKAKARVRGIPELNAAAGPHEIGGSPKDPLGVYPLGITGREDSVISSAPKTIYNPVNYLLDYILEHSVARLAIASDVDLYAIFLNSPFPTDVRSALLEVRPTIHVDKCGVGTVAVDDAPPYESQQDILTTHANGPGSFTEHQKWVKPQHTKAISFCEGAYSPWFTTPDPLQLLTRDILAPALYKDIRPYDIAMSARAALRNLSLRTPLDDLVTLALLPGITMNWHPQGLQSKIWLRCSLEFGGGH